MGNKQKEKRLGWAGSCFAVVVITVVVVVVVVALRSSPIDKIKVGKEKKSWIYSALALFFYTAKDSPQPHTPFALGL